VDQSPSFRIFIPHFTFHIPHFTILHFTHSHRVRSVTQKTVAKISQNEERRRELRSQEYTLKRANAWMKDGEKHSKALEAKCTEMCAHIQ